MFGDWEYSARTWRVVATLCLTILTGLTTLAGRAEAGLTMTADAKGGVGHLISFQARYDAIENAPVNYLAGTFTASLNGGLAFNAGPASISAAALPSPEPNTIAAATLGASFAIGMAYRRRIRSRNEADPEKTPATSGT
jgi:hypothetical protein